MVWKNDESDAGYLLANGIVLAEPDLVKRAIAMGADVDEVEFVPGAGPSSPFFELIDLRFSLYVSSDLASDQLQERKRNDQVIDLILQETLNVDRRDDANLNYMDRILLCEAKTPQAVDLMARILVSTIHDAAIGGNTDYRINYAAIVSGRGDGRDPYHPVRQAVMTTACAVLDRVREKLSEPRTEKEQRLVEAFPEVARKWMSEPKLPDLADLPMPTERYREAVGRMREFLRTDRENADPESGLQRSPRSEFSRAGSEDELQDAIDDAKVEIVLSQLEPPPRRKDGPI